MNKLTVAVCDMDDLYRRRFAAYLVEYKSEEFMVYSFSIPELLFEEIERTKFDIAIIGTGFQKTENVLKKANIQVIRMITSMSEHVWEAEDNEEKKEDNSCIFKFQPMESIIHEMRVLSSEKYVICKEKEIISGLEIIGIYSPIRHEMQTPFSTIFSVFLAEKKKVLYINLMGNSEFTELFGGIGEYDIGDIVVQLRRQKLTPESFWRCTYEIESVICIPPFSNPEHLHELTLEDYLAFLEFVKKRTDFELIVVDFGEGMDRFAQMLAVCTSIYCPIKSGYFYECRIRRFMEYIKTVSIEGTEEKIHFAELPFSAKNIRGGNVVEQLLYSEFGDNIRGFLVGAEDEGG